MSEALARTGVARRSATGWLVFAGICLMVGACAGIPMVVARLFPGAAAAIPPEIAKKALVLHVNFLSFLWCLALVAFIWARQIGGRSSVFAWWGLMLASLGGVLLLGLAASDAPSPVLISYFPMNRHPLFPAGLALAGAGALVVGFGTAIVARREKTFQYVASLPLLLPLGLVGASLLWLSQQQGNLPVHARIDLTAWGVGHAFQFFVVGAMVFCWTEAVRSCESGRRFLSARRASMVVMLAVMPALLSVPLQLYFGIEETGFRSGMAMLVAWGIWPVPLVFALWTLAKCRAYGRCDWSAEARFRLLISFVFFLLGAVIGLSSPAWQGMNAVSGHATFGALFAAALGIVGPVSGQRGARSFSGYSRLAMLSYLAMTAIIALAASGAGEMILMPDGSTGVIDVIVGLLGASSLVGLFAVGLISSVGSCSIRHSGTSVDVTRSDSTGLVARRDVRGPAIAVVVMSVALFGALVAWWPPSMLFRGEASGLDQREMRRHVSERINAEAALRFEQGVAMLNAKQYDFAVTAFHRVLQLAPQMPEAHVNMGFALLEKGEFKAAHDFFSTAIELKTEQLNAYYGLGLALAGLGEYAAAAAAMQTYVHLAPAADHFASKAAAKLREIEGLRDASRQSSRGRSP